MSDILQWLDDDDPEITTDALAGSCVEATFCQECGHVDNEPKDYIGHPCTTCGQQCKVRRPLYGGEEHDLIQAVFDCYRSKVKRICVLLSCALVERHLYILVFNRCRWLKIPDRTTKDNLQRKWRFKDRIDFFKSLIAAPPNSIFSQDEVKRLFDGYNRLKRKRDAIAHSLPGASYVVKKADIDLAVQMAEESFRAFAELHHVFCSISSPPLPRSCSFSKIISTRAVGPSQ